MTTLIEAICACLYCFTAWCPLRYLFLIFSGASHEFFLHFVSQVLSVGNHYPPDVKYSYSLSVDADFTWSQLGRWSKCDRVCNGTSRRQVVCTSNDRDQIPVSDSKCERQRLPKPPPLEMRCNTGCTIG